MYRSAGGTKAKLCLNSRTGQSRMRIAGEANVSFFHGFRLVHHGLTRLGVMSERRYGIRAVWVHAGGPRELRGVRQERPWRRFAV